MKLDSRLYRRRSKRFRPLWKTTTTFPELFVQMPLAITAFRVFRLDNIFSGQVGRRGLLIFHLPGNSTAPNRFKSAQLIAHVKVMSRPFPVEPPPFTFVEASRERYRLLLETILLFLSS